MAYEDIQKRLGFRARKDGLLADPELRRHIDWMGALRYDWPHTFLADGFVGAEVWALVAGFKTCFFHCFLVNDQKKNISLYCLKSITGCLPFGDHFFNYFDEN